SLIELHFRVGGGNRAASIMIRNGLYLATTRFLDGVDAHNRHIMVLRDGTIRGGGPFFYTVGSFTYSDGKWKGEMTSQSIHLLLVPILGHERLSASDLAEPILMMVLNSRP